MAYRLALGIIRTIIWFVAHIEVTGMENVKDLTGCIVVSNHLGRLDAILVYNFFDRQDLTIMAAEKYRKYAIVRWFVNALGAMWVDRFNADFSAMRTAMNRIKQGGVLVIAPEGTRSRTGALIQGRAGASYLAARSGAWIIPVAITGTEDKLVLARLKRFRRAQVKVNIGKAFQLPPLKGDDRNALLQQYTDEIMCRIAVMLPPEYRGFYTDHPRLKELLAEVS